MAHILHDHIGPLFSLFFRKNTAVQRNRSSAVLLQAAESTGKRRLASPVLTSHRYDFAAMDLKLHLFQYLAISQPHRKPFYRKRITVLR